MDRENKLGAEWSPELMTALKTCRVFVPLYSRRYFESDNCGKEWFAFAQREVIHRAQGGEVVNAIVPALWTRLDREKIPVVAQSFQYDHADLGERYCAEGFYGIMKLRNYRGDYQRAVYRLAERIMEIGDKSVAYADDDVQSMELKDFESLPSAFGPASARRTRTDSFRLLFWPTIPRRSRPAAPAITTVRRRIPGARTTRIIPGPSPITRWSWPRSALTASPVLGSFEDDRLGWSNGAVPPSLCLVDAWVSMSETYRERLSLLDQICESWVSVLVPWNAEDTGLSAAEDDLRAKLRQQLGHKLASVPRRCRMAANGIPTLQDFSQLLPEMTIIMLKRYQKDAPARPPKGPTIERPRLRQSGPGDFGGSQ